MSNDVVETHSAILNRFDRLSPNSLESEQVIQYAQTLALQDIAYKLQVLVSNLVGDAGVLNAVDIRLVNLNNTLVAAHGLGGTAEGSKAF